MFSPPVLTPHAQYNTYTNDAMGALTEAKLVDILWVAAESAEEKHKILLVLCLFLYFLFSLSHKQVSALIAHPYKTTSPLLFPQLVLLLRIHVIFVHCCLLLCPIAREVPEIKVFSFLGISLT